MSHWNHGRIPAEYTTYISRKLYFLTGLCFIAAILFIMEVSLGAVHVPMQEILRVFSGMEADVRFKTIIYNIRLPHAFAALLAGAGLSAAGTAMQSILRNPLGSPFTLGLSQAGAFGAAFSVMMLGTGAMQSTQVGAVTVFHPTYCRFPYSPQF